MGVNPFIDIYIYIYISTGTENPKVFTHVNIAAVPSKIDSAMLGIIYMMSVLNYSAL